MLTYLSLSPYECLRILPEVNVKIIVNFYKTEPGVLALKNNVIKYIVENGRRTGRGIKSWSTSEKRVTPLFLAYIPDPACSLKFVVI